MEKMFKLIILLQLFTSGGSTNEITVVPLAGSYYEMGYQYGNKLAVKLRQTLEIIHSTDLFQENLTKLEALKGLEKFNERFYFNFKLELDDFFKGVSIGSGLALEDLQILNAVEVFNFSSSQQGNEQQVTFQSGYFNHLNFFNNFNLRRY